MSSSKKLFLLDGMPLLYRGYFALINRPIFTSKGFNTSALFVFTQTLLDILNKQEPTHIAVAFDTSEPTQRHKDFPQYKAQREEMPEELSASIQPMHRLIEAFNIPVLVKDGFEADDLIGTLVRKAEKEGFQSYMVTPDKDFCQLVTPKTLLYKPSRMGQGEEILGVKQVVEKWGIEKPEQVADILALWGDASDNIPGVPGIGEKTASKLISQYGSVENLLKHTSDLKGKLKENLEKHKEQAQLSKKLATILTDAPVDGSLDDLRRRSLKEEDLKSLLIDLEFNTLGKRLFGEDFQAGRGYQNRAGDQDSPAQSEGIDMEETQSAELSPSPTPSADLKKLADTPHTYHLVQSSEQRAQLIAQLQSQPSFCFDTETTSLDPREAILLGLAFSFQKQEAYYVPLTGGEGFSLSQSLLKANAILEEFRPLLEDERIEKVGHNLKFDLAVLRWHGIKVKGPLWDTMLAHSLLEPDQRHGMDYLAESLLGYSPISITTLIGDKGKEQRNMSQVDLDPLAEYAAEDADVTWQLRSQLQPLIQEKGQERVFYQIEAPLIPVLVEMEFEGIHVDRQALEEFALDLEKEIQRYEKQIHQLAGRPFNLNSPKQLGEILFDDLKIVDRPKKTRTGQYSTNEQTLIALANQHEIVRQILDYREITKLKSTYVDTLPQAIHDASGRVHTTYNQAITSTGRLQSQNPNLQNIPIRTELGRKIRKAFIPRDPDYRLLSADYSQIELRIIAALSKDKAMLDAFQKDLDIHTATAARVYGVALNKVSDEMRRNAKMVNFGIIYGISSFGLAQRLGIPRNEAANIIAQYMQQYPGVQRYMDETLAFCREHGYVETVSGRRRYIRDINSANATVRSAAERNAINAPIQGTAADLIKIAMVRIHRELEKQNARTKMLLQVHDELVFDLYKPEEKDLLPMVEQTMKNALPLSVPIQVELGLGHSWLEAH